MERQQFHFQLFASVYNISIPILSFSLIFSKRAFKIILKDENNS